MDKPITVSVNPSYFCNFRCDFCYLTEEQLSDQKKIELEKLDDLLSQIPNIEQRYKKPPTYSTGGFKFLINS